MAGQSFKNRRTVNRKRITGLIGYPLSHSFSRDYFSEKFKREGLNNYQYLNFEIDSIEKINNVILDNPELIGLNVTIPHKESVIPYLQDLSAEAGEIGAVNTICINRTKLTGHNTDHIGFSKSLEMVLDKEPSGALILGTGGASKAVEYSLRKRGINYVSISRKPDGNILGYKDIDEKLIRNYPLIINTTPLGMYPNIDQAPELPYNLISRDNILIDLVYNPEKTKFLQLGEMAGSRILNGLPMLIEQAEASWALWTNG